MSKHPAHRAWCAIRYRCQLPTHQAWKNYGARGITVCTRWTSFENFWADMGPTYRLGLTLERRDNNKGYNPGNCYWTTYRTQNNNTRRNRRIQTPWGKMTVAEAAQRSGLGKTTLHYRLQHHWPVTDLFIPADLENRWNRSTTS
jgi:hypothetical protein